MQGGINYEKLNFVYKKILTMVGERIANEGDKNKSELVDIFINGKNCVQEEKIKAMEEYIIKNIKIEN